MTGFDHDQRQRPSWPALAASIGCAICLAVGVIPLFMGIFPVFLGPVSRDLGWGLSVFPQAPLIIGLTTALTGPFIGRMVDRHGARRLLPWGLAVWCAGLFGLSTMNGSIASLYLVAIVIGLGGTVAGPIIYAKVVNGWFDRNRGLALGLVLGGVPAIATAIAVPVSQLLVDEQGWRAAVRILAVVAAIISIPAAWLLVREKTASVVPGHAPIAQDGLTGPEALRSRDFALTIGASALAVGALMGVTNHFLAWMAERGIDKDAGTLALSLYSLAGPLGPLFGGLLVDRVSSPRIVAGFFVLPVIGILLLSYGGAVGVVPGMMLLGLAFSSINGFAPYLVSRYFGMKAASEILGVTFAVLTVGMGLGPVLIGLGHDMTGSYTVPMTVAAGVMLFALLLAITFRPYRFSAGPRP